MEQSPFKVWSDAAEFLFFTARTREQHVGARYADGTIWITQNMIAAIFDVTVITIMEYLKDLYETGEIARDETVRRFKVVQREGSRMIGRNMDFYSLDAVISIAYRLNTLPAVQFRKWATRVLGQMAVKGFTLDGQQAASGPFFGWNQFVRFIEGLR
ncbi:virulence RhuM family protein [Desulfococcaceae bacterium OttesenSCG-928-F15]|nr:virulence RhuM family protein [Desulfococcaceae bacterium OttesenSCG-928-F15]